jgi:4-aminobutyrate aminotransferase
MIVEPISGNGGNIVPPPGYLNKLKAMCEEHGIVLIFDEVQTGFGRTGEMFAADYFGVAPHAMTVAKGLGGIGLQVAAILTEERLVGLDSDHHSFTYGSNVLACAGAAKTIEVLRRPGFLENVRRVGAHFKERFHDLQRTHDMIWDVRGVGLMWGLELADARTAQRAYAPQNVLLTNHVAKRGLHHGLLLRTSRYGRGNVLKIRPPLVMTMEDADDVCDRLDRLFTEIEVA